ncbi:MAG: DUF1178 family protein [Alphaproteobacteria bacterium]|nr:DUF1178 family protein [Alphaproteobacteria bacterium]
MIHYSLVCENRHAFDAWFKNAAAFDQQVEMGIVTCPICSTHNVQKSIMAPAVARSGEDRSRPETPPPQLPRTGDKSGEKMTFSAGHPQQAQLRDALRQLRDALTSEADYVGDRFATEARKIHFHEVEARGIYGEATRDEVNDLVEDGIEFMPLPQIPEDHN